MAVHSDLFFGLVVYKPGATYQLMPELREEVFLRELQERGVRCTVFSREVIYCRCAGSLDS